MSMIGKIEGGVLGAVKGFVTGGPVGAITGAAGALFGGGNRPPAPVPAGSLPGGASGTAFTFPGFGFSHVTQGGGGGGAVAPGNGGACPKGYHLNKHPLAASRSHGAVPRLSVCVRNRHMNAMNGRAVSRAARRIHAGEKLLRRIYRVTGKKHGAIHPKTGKRK